MIYNHSVHQVSLALIFVAPFVGSFLGVVIDRLPRRKPFLIGRSRCDACGKAIPFWHLVPLLSFIWLGGRAACCGAPIPRRHPMVELAAAALAVLSVLLLPPPFLAFQGAVLGWLLLALAWIDAKRFILPDQLTLTLLVAGLAFAGLAALPAHILGAALGYGSFRLISLLYLRWRGQEGLGHGDAKLLAAGGAWAGPLALADIILVAALLGVIYTLAVQRRRRGGLWRRRLPFGPPLALAIWLVWMAGTAYGHQSGAPS